MRDDDGPDGRATPTRSRSLTPHQIRQFVAGALVVLLILFAVLNLDEVRVNWIVVTTQTPLIVVVAASFLIGLLTGLLLLRSRAGRGRG